MNNKPIKQFSNEELEKLELQLWRQKHAYTASLEQITHDLSLITSELASRNESDDSTDGQAAAS
jgi:hypothetical protein